jgi:hypothetical protein
MRRLHRNQIRHRFRVVRTRTIHKINLPISVVVAIALIGTFLLAIAREILTALARLHADVRVLAEE